MLARGAGARCNGGMLVVLLHGWWQVRRGALAASLLLAAAHLGIMSLATWGALAWAQPSLPSDPASPQAPPSVVAPPRPAPGSDQTGLLRDRLLRQSFGQADRNRDGRLGQEEAAALPGLAQRYGQVDRDGDGWISREEFRAAGGP